LRASSEKKLKHISIPLISLKAIISNLRKIIDRLKSSPGDTEWAAYYDTMLNYSDEAFKNKGTRVTKCLDDCGAVSVCDMGANRGEFSKCAPERTGSYVVAYDVDHTAVNQHYLHVKATGKANVLPLVLDLTNPSPAIGWANEERTPLEGRANFDCIMALALIHHLAISNNVPLERVAEYFSRLGRHLIIEFVPKADSQVKKLLLNREDIFENYTESGFESAFACYFELLKKETITGSSRTLYLYKNRYFNPRHHKN
jgi:2-polyprenyl-3-methyl-5-hydroxy-6-metoxy-1,4-benzoquinol methylase